MPCKAGEGTEETPPLGFPFQSLKLTVTIPRERGHATFILWELRSFPQNSHDQHIRHALGSSFSGLNTHVPLSKAQIFWLLGATSTHQVPMGRERGLPLLLGPWKHLLELSREATRQVTGGRGVQSYTPTYPAWHQPSSVINH